MQAMTPLFTSANDNVEIIPDLPSKEMVKKLAENLIELKLKCQESGNSDL